MSKNISQFQYWERLYTEGKDIWSYGKVSPALLEFFEHPLCPKKGDVLVPAAGRGWDAAAWAHRGHKVLAVDFCPSAIDSIETLACNNSSLSSLNLDIFLLSPQDEKRGGKQFDIIYDSCSFNSIHPSRRDEFGEVLMKMLKKDGLLVEMFFPLTDEKRSSPPYSLARDEVKARIKGIMEIKEIIVPKESFEYRMGKEEIWLMKKV